MHYFMELRPPVTVGEWRRGEREDGRRARMWETRRADTLCIYRFTYLVGNLLCHLNDFQVSASRLLGMPTRSRFISASPTIFLADYFVSRSPLRAYSSQPDTRQLRRSSVIRNETRRLAQRPLTLPRTQSRGSRGGIEREPPSIPTNHRIVVAVTEFDVS